MKLKFKLLKKNLNLWFVCRSLLWMLIYFKIQTTLCQISSMDFMNGGGKICCWCNGFCQCKFMIRWWVVVETDLWGMDMHHSRGKGARKVFNWHRTNWYFQQEMTWHKWDAFSKSIFGVANLFQMSSLWQDWNRKNKFPTSKTCDKDIGGRF